MVRTCKKCGHVDQAGDAGELAACPKCGAIYSKVDLALAAKAAAEAEAAEIRRHRDEKKAAADRRASQARERQLLNGWVCMACGKLGRPKRRVPGSLAVEIALWLAGLLVCATIVWIALGGLILIAAFIYSVWRLGATRKRECRSCGSNQIVRGNSPKGREELVRQGLIGQADGEAR